MCCIFTCCGWMIDLFQRLWTFTMACCISSAVCCAIITASMSGIALGYNYSLAEYIDLKETNVSVFLKRGVFDDEIADDMNWRRSGHMPIAGHVKDDNLITGAPEEGSNEVRAGRRMDDSIFESDDHNRFEGSLMKLTAKAVDLTTTTIRPDIPRDLVEKAVGSAPEDSLDQLKAVQSLINRRKMEYAKATPSTPKPTKTITEQKMPLHLRLPSGNARRVHGDVSPPSNSLRYYVPDTNIGEAHRWANPRLPPHLRVTVEGDYAEPTFPSPVTPRVGPLRPVRPIPAQLPTLTTRATQTTTNTRVMQKFHEEEMKAFKDRLLMDKMELPGLKNENNNAKGPEGMEDYEDAIGGLPVRRKRDIKTDMDTFVIKPDGYNAKHKHLNDYGILGHILNKFNPLSFFIVSETTKSSSKIQKESQNNNQNLSTQIYLLRIMDSVTDGSIKQKW